MKLGYNRTPLQGLTLEIQEIMLKNKDSQNLEKLPKLKERNLFSEQLQTAPIDGAVQSQPFISTINGLDFKIICANSFFKIRVCPKYFGQLRLSFVNICLPLLCKQDFFRLKARKKNRTFQKKKTN